MKVIIAGSRTITYRDKVSLTIHNILTKINITPTEIISGAAVGVDRIGESYARMFSIPVTSMPADWNKYGKAAGPIRNKAMAEVADIAIVIWDGKSTGAKNMITEMSKLNKPCFVHII